MAGWVVSSAKPLIMSALWRMRPSSLSAAASLSADASPRRRRLTQPPMTCARERLSPWLAIIAAAWASLVALATPTAESPPAARLTSMDAWSWACCLKRSVGRPVELPPVEPLPMPEPGEPKPLPLPGPVSLPATTMAHAISRTITSRLIALL
ncbi:MAG: hypothetical protein J3K34DRAFT_398014 [Monoraphidium minutum]|nr:MAG: hypothetical protein J3K34DRAFT_398014 [Monoraphidium minutum]